MLSLQKPIFLYVNIILIFITLILIIRNKKSLSLLFSLIFSFSITIPFQYYVYKNTGNILSISNASAETLYWMTSPHKGEYGDWQNSKFNSNCINMENSCFCNKNYFIKP